MRCLIQAVSATALFVTLAAGAQTNAAAGLGLPTIEPLSAHACQAMEQHHSLRPDNPVACQRLRAVHFSYRSDAGIKTDGELVVLDVIAPQVADLMHELAERGFYIDKARPVEDYDGNDLASMNDNDTSAFNGRRTATSRSWSLHAYGVAIDLNPLQNPSIYPNQREDADGNVVPGQPGTALVRPAASSSGSDNYLNRNVYRARPGQDGFYRPGMAESVVELFAYHGFLSWGGDWNDPLDYQHFEVGPRRFIERMYAADPADSTDPVKGRRLFARYVKTYRSCLASKHGGTSDASPRRAFCARETINPFL
ncbi:M15 family metallopeptidase [Dyella choica]|nr:M15 family metallopeptidase [Dyella choica]